MNTENNHRDPSPFGGVIYACSRWQAVADGAQVDVSKVSVEAGIRFPLFRTRAVFDQYLAVPEGVTSQAGAGQIAGLDLAAGPERVWAAWLTARVVA